MIHKAAKVLSFYVPVKLALTLTNENRLQVYDEWVQGKYFEPRKMN